MPVTAAVALVGAGTAAYQANKAGDAADAQAGAARAGQQEYMRLNQPFVDAGTSALSRLERLNAGDFSAFQESPDYQFALSQGIEGINRAAASRGALNAGGTDVDLLRFGQGLASQNYGNYYSRLSDLARLGQSSAQAAGNQAVNTQSTIGGAQAGADINQANAYSNFASGLAGLGGQFYGQGGFGQNNQSTFTQSPQIGPVTRQPISYMGQIQGGGF